MQITRENTHSAIVNERKYWEALVNEVGAERAEQPGVMGDWNFKDLAAHLTVWRERTINRLLAAAEGQPEPPPPWPAALGTEDFDVINDWIHEQHRDRPLEDVLKESMDSYDRLAGAVGAFSDEELNDPTRFAWLEGKSLGAAIHDRSLFDHLHEDHEPDVRAFLAGNR